MKELADYNYNELINRDKLNKNDYKEAKEDTLMPYIIVNPIFGEDFHGGNFGSINNFNGILLINIDSSSSFSKTAIHVEDKLCIGYKVKQN
jgi:hypothetical protein